MPFRIDPPESLRARFLEHSCRLLIPIPLGELKGHLREIFNKPSLGIFDANAGWPMYTLMSSNMKGGFSNPMCMSLTTKWGIFRGVGMMVIPKSGLYRQSDTLVA